MIPTITIVFAARSALAFLQKSPQVARWRIQCRKLSLTPRTLESEHPLLNWRGASQSMRIRKMKQQNYPKMNLNGETPRRNTRQIPHDHGVWNDEVLQNKRCRYVIRFHFWHPVHFGTSSGALKMIYIAIQMGVSRSWFLIIFAGFRTASHQFSCYGSTVHEWWAIERSLSLNVNLNLKQRRKQKKW